MKDIAKYKNMTDEQKRALIEGFTSMLGEVVEEAVYKAEMLRYMRPVLPRVGVDEDETNAEQKRKFLSDLI